MSNSGWRLTHSNNSGKFERLKIRKPGDWKGMTIYAEELTNVTQLVEKFTSDLQEFRTSVDACSLRLLANYLMHLLGQGM